MGAPTELANEGVIQMAGELALSPTVLPIPGASRPQASPTAPRPPASTSPPRNSRPSQQSQPLTELIKVQDIS